MNTPQKLPLEKLFELLDSEHARVARAIYTDYQVKIDSLPGSNTKHQAWVGGYRSHIEEAMNIGRMLHENLTACRNVDATLSSVLFCVYIHDFDKLLRYTMQPDGTWQGKPADKDGYIAEMVDILHTNYSYELTDAEYNAIKYAHGESDTDYDPSKRIILPLGTIVHCADIISARVWHDYGKTSDSWKD